MLTVLKKICVKLNGHDINWALTGSMGQSLQGVKVQPKDIDIITDREGIYKIEHLLSEFITIPVSYKSAEKLRSFFGAFYIEKTSVEVMSEVENLLEKGRWEKISHWEQQKKNLNIDNYQIPVLALSHEYKWALKLKNTERAKRIQELEWH